MSRPAVPTPFRRSRPAAAVPTPRQMAGMTLTMALVIEAVGLGVIVMAHLFLG